MKAVYGFVYIPLYILWLIYRLFIKKDLRQHKNDFYGLTFFVIVWALIYYWIFFKEINHFVQSL